MASSPLRLLALGALIVAVVAAAGCPEGSATCHAAQDAVNDEAMALLQVAREGKENQTKENQTDKQNATQGWNRWSGGPCACVDGGSGWICGAGECCGYKDGSVCNANSGPPPCQCVDHGLGHVTGVCADGRPGCCGDKDGTACSYCTCSDGGAGALGVCKNSLLRGCCGFADGTKCN
mmetsp:Transcript_12559/g.35251  ORF Transcript_12559/g.35251 Transcript_12559/m.35251 type:complete len:178 (-) Transcript_12559:3-536(-)